MQAIRPVNYKDLVAVFEKDGFVFIRQKGSHLSFKKQGIPRTLIIPTYRSVGIDIIQTLLRTAGMSRERYFKLLNK